ncbi:hypothetical protein F5B17DRAFT_152383 [Nemania serpens]|nr:hypothetical protein F5B17DRAFT_152383 [Nemania serpens]
MYCDGVNSRSESSHVIIGLGCPEHFSALDLEPPVLMQQPLFDNWNAGFQALSNRATTMRQASSATLFRKAATVEEKAAVVLDSLSRKLARALSILTEDIDPRQPLHAFGVDSLVAVELKNWLAAEFDAELAVYELMGGRSISAICDLVTGKVTSTG